MPLRIRQKHAGERLEAGEDDGASDYAQAFITLDCYKVFSLTFRKYANTVKIKSQRLPRDARF
ncbi:hypothetical protein [Pseudomonas sp. AN-1]|uniref:hypothetical protein n=1 Tax=Pseudomonas sp. AN-1 TaxID=3096605 RepID=UPI002A6B876D|nr:hypothetical protein [Pseudomonas sp. AN-1]WPP43780.1 hypothetical protein SK095_10755 [Pseudomonas sp. AN-1]